MEALNSARRTLEQAEASLRTLVAKAADSGDYDAVDTLTAWARAIAAIHDSSAQSSSVATDTISGQKVKKNGQSKQVKSSSYRTPRSNEYPKFFRDGNSLVKVAWSKSFKAEYEHKASLEVVSQFAESFTKAGKSSGIVTMEEILPLRDSDGQEVPSYQNYLTLAWLKKTGLVRQHGRKGYSLKPGGDLRKDSAAAFKKLQVRNASQ